MDDRVEPIGRPRIWVDPDENEVMIGARVETRTE
jgi:hypothetical protein